MSTHLRALLSERDWREGVVGRKVGVFGGTFDPVHVGHLVLAECAREELGLDRVVFMPARVPPHKHGRSVGAAGDQRAAMLAAAIAGNPGFGFSTLELERDGVSYTVETLEQLHELAPDIELTLLIGGDNAREFRTWREPSRIAELAHIAVWHRPGSHLPSELMPGLPMVTIAAPLLDISSSEIRSRTAAGRSIRYLVSDGVADFIVNHGLYR